MTDCQSAPPHQELVPRRLLALVALLLFSVESVWSQTPIPHKGDDKALQGYLAATRAREPGEALQTFRLLDGFRLDLVAHEPLVEDPVAGAFDEDGRLFIAELADYPYRPPDGTPPSGRIRLLEDTDGDGFYDRSQIFADQLLWPTGIAIWKQGIFVAATPDIWYLQDTDGDGRADLRQRVFTGFGTQKAQGSLNNLIWGIDHRIYGAGSSNGGQVRVAGRSARPAVPMDRKDFRFDPTNRSLEALSGRAQFGNTFDDWYNRFLSSQGTPAYHVVLPDHYLARNRHAAAPNPVKNLHPGPTPIFRISPLERWRIIRSTRRITSGFRPADSIGVSQHVLDGAAGATVYRGDAFPDAFRGCLFVGGALTNLVHRMRLAADGVTFQVSRADRGTEFLRSTDNWFRPVNFLNAPDGTLYVLDFSREHLEATHIPHDVAKHVDLTSGRQRGRIYRVAPQDLKPGPPPRLSDATIDQLVGHLESANGWVRETAHRLLFQKQSAEAIDPLRKLLRQSRSPLARLHAMWSLEGLGNLDGQDLLSMLADEAAGNREHAVRLAEPRLARNRTLCKQVLCLAGDRNARVRFQVAFSLGALSGAESTAALAAIARRDSADLWISTAILSSSAARSHDLVERLCSDRQQLARVSARLLRQLAEVVGVRNQRAEMTTLLEAAGGLPPEQGAYRQEIVRGLALGLSRTGQRLFAMQLQLPADTRDMLASTISRSLADSVDRDLAVSRRIRAIELLSFSTFETVQRTLQQLLVADQAPEVQSAVIACLASFRHRESVSLLVSRCPDVTPARRQEILSAVLEQAESLEPVLLALQRGVISPSEIGGTQRELLLARLSPAQREQSSMQLLAVRATRATAVAQFQSSLSLPGDRARGAKVYARECSACHRYQGQGHEVGPNLALTKSKSAQELLVQILDPSREVDPRFVQHSVVDKRGRVHTGMIAAETSTGLTIKQAEGKQSLVLRSDVDRIDSSGKSLMPEGLEQKINYQEMADLISFLRTIQYDLGTDPGLVEPSQAPNPRSPRAASETDADITNADEDYVFTPRGFHKPGRMLSDPGQPAGRLDIVIRDRATGEPTFCRVNVVGPDGNFYQPAENPLSAFSLMGNWPSPGRRGDPRNRPDFGYGNRAGKAPIRYFGHFFYSSGKFQVAVPAGEVRVEVWKGFEYRPQVGTVTLAAGQQKQLELTLARTSPMEPEGYFSGDPHLHLYRSTDEDDQRALDLLEAEDVRYGGLLSYNYRTASYVGRMRALEYPSRLGVGLRSVLRRGNYRIMSGQEYRSRAYGHMNLFLTDRLALENTALDPNTWPVYGLIGHEVRSLGGYAYHAHGGYGKEIYADYVSGAVQGVELLQFGVYRGIGLEGWYNILNCGFRFAAHGASDYPPCRKMSDCRTYVHAESPPRFADWLHAAAEGKSFFTSGPLILLEVDGQAPGTLLFREGAGPHRVTVRVRVKSEVAPVSHVALIVNGKPVVQNQVALGDRQSKWIELEQELSLTESSWIAARAWSRSPSGSPDAEAHTNPVYVYLDRKAPYSAGSLQWLLDRLDEQIVIQQRREFAERDRVLAYYGQARRRLLEVRQRRGQAIPADTNRRPDARDLETPEVLRQLELLAARYETGEDWQERIEQVRRGVMRSMKLAPLPKKTPLRAIIHSRREYDGYSVENVALETFPGFYCTGNLYRPTKVDGPLAAVLCPHGHFRPLGRYRANHQIRCAHLARMGAVVFSYSMVGWQDSQQTSHQDDPHVIALQTWNSIRVVDFLTGLAGVDPSRVAATGASGGATQSILAAIADDRIRAIAPVTVIYPWYTGCNCESGMGIMNSPATNAIELVASVAPRPSLIISCQFTWSDRLRADRTSHFSYVGFPFVRRVYDALGAGNQLQHLHFADEAHDFGPSKRNAVYEFLAAHLQLNLLPEATDTIPIESPEQLQAVGPQHPLPSDAARDSRAVAAAFERLIQDRDGG